MFAVCMVRCTDHELFAWSTTACLLFAWSAVQIMSRYNVLGLLSSPYLTGPLKASHPLLPLPPLPLPPLPLPTPYYSGSRLPGHEFNYHKTESNRWCCMQGGGGDRKSILIEI